jgi:ribosomal protein S1
MGWSRVSDTSQVVRPGDEITVKVLRVDEDAQKISLGLKQLSEDPWSKVGETYDVGQVRAGRVTRLAEFGAFVELEPGVEALAHASTFAPIAGNRSWANLVPPGTTAAFEIVSIDPEKKRIGVALVPEGSARASRAAASNPEAEDVRDFAERQDAAAPERIGSLADQLRGALKPRDQ